MKYVYLTLYCFVQQDFPSQDAVQIANNISNLGQVYNKEDIATDAKVTREK